MFSYLSYAFYALLRRNIIAFQVGRHPYLSGRDEFAGREAGIPKEEYMLAALTRFFREYRCYNRSLTELSRLGDRELADIGISRSDIPRVAWNAAHRH